MSDKTGFLPSFVEGRIIEAFSKYLGLLADLGLSFPLFVAVTVAFVKGQKPSAGDNLWDVQYAIYDSAGNRRAHSLTNRHFLVSRFALDIKRCFSIL